MNQEKPFDCVEMKWDIQSRHQQEVEILGKAEAARLRWQRVLDDPVLGAFVREHPVGRARKSQEETVR